MIFKVLSLFCTLISIVEADVYMHSPRGSNNRLNEKTANRKTGNRVFDSQNNNRGGYNVGDKTNQAANNNAANQYQMQYFQSSKNAKKDATPAGISNLPIEWTNQHGCGGNEDDNPNKLNCHLVLQYMCEPNENIGEAKFRMRDGVNTNRQNYQNPQNNENRNTFINRKRNSVQENSVYQEPLEWYDKCTQRERNKGLFTADQKVGNDATDTRQNPNGNRNGYECPEERDYYPYWHPSDWKDIGILAENASMCEYFQSESFNVKPKYECVENWPNTNTPKHYSKHNNEADCKTGGGVWTEFHSYLEKATQFTNENTCNAANNAANKALKITYKWGRPIYGTESECLVALDKPFCKQSPFSRTNHLGNGADLEALNENWEIPHFPSGKEQRCVMRLRYNISTDDYDPYKTDSNNNTNYETGVRSPVEQNPAVDIGAQNIPLRLAINTAQFGRTFQDRSHLFILKPRTAEIGETANLQNLNVRGKRGNIVQVYPAVEYDFFPTNLEIAKKDLVHIQWTGSNSHNNQPPGGDGQTGDDGQGQRGTDRNNILGMNGRAENFPLTMEDPDSIFNNVDRVLWQGVGAKLVDKDLTAADKLDIAVQMASAGYYECAEDKNCGSNSVASKNAMNNLLNNAPASYAGMVMRFNAGVYNYTCTRNNNFSNRSQKGSLIVK